MSDIKVNDKLTVEGKFSVATTVNNATKPPQVQINGVFQSAEYIEEITKLENDRYVIAGVKISQESFGSEEEDIFYTFTAGSVKVKRKGGKTNGR
jgi:hypothetical protein